MVRSVFLGAPLCTEVFSSVPQSDHLVAVLITFEAKDVFIAPVTHLDHAVGHAGREEHSPEWPEIGLRGSHRAMEAITWEECVIN